MDTGNIVVGAASIGGFLLAILSVIVSWRRGMLDRLISWLSEHRSRISCYRFGGYYDILGKARSYYCAVTYMSAYEWFKSGFAGLLAALAHISKERPNFRVARVIVWPLSWYKRYRFHLFLRINFWLGVHVYCVREDAIGKCLGDSDLSVPGNPNLKIAYDAVARLAKDKIEFFFIDKFIDEAHPEKGQGVVAYHGKNLKPAHNVGDFVALFNALMKKALLLDERMLQSENGVYEAVRDHNYGSS